MRGRRCAGGAGMSLPAVILPGCGRLAVTAVAGASALTDLAGANPLKLLASCARGPAAWVYAGTYGGGLLAGDAVDLDVQVGSGARLFLGTQAGTKIHRSDDGRTATWCGRAAVAPGGLLVHLPDPTTPYAGSRYEQVQTVDLRGDASLVWLDAMTGGRTARGERWQAAAWRSRLAIDLDGRPLLRDGLLLDPAHGDPAARAGRFNAVATLVLGGPLLAGRVQAALALGGAVQRGAPLLIGAAPLGGGWGAVVRCAAVAHEQVERMLTGILAPLDDLLGDDPWRRRP